MFTYRNVTITDIADKLRVAPSTVSRALNNDPSISEKRRKEVVALAIDFGYQANDIARNLRNKKTKTIGVILPRVDNRFMSSVLAGIGHVVNRNGYSLLISDSSESTEKEASCARAMFQNRPDGLLLALSAGTTDLSHFESFFKNNTPVIFFHQSLNCRDAQYVSIDNRQAGYDATSHLISQGCENLLCVLPESRPSVYLDRFKGFQEACQEYGLASQSLSAGVSHFNRETGDQIASAILAMETMPDGVFIADDECAVGCMLSLKKVGIDIPGQIAFVGFNNEPVSTVVQPALTTVQYPAYEMGEIAAGNLIDKLNGVRQHASAKILHSELIVRESSLKTG